jgi:general nucleoside transport system permease protein
MKIRIVAVERKAVTPAQDALILLLSLAAGLFVMGLVFAFSGKNPFFGILKIFQSGFFSDYGFVETISRTVPLVLTAAGLCYAFRGKFWNIGAEGQILAGACFSAWVGISFPQLPFFVLIPLMTLAGALGGSLWALIASSLKLAFQMNEVISTLMLNYVAAELVRFLIVGPWKGPTQHGYCRTDDLGANAILACIPGTRIPYYTLILAVLAVGMLFVLIFRTKSGYELRVLGENREAARYAGIDARRTLTIAAIVTGGLAGIAGFGEVAAHHHHIADPDTISANYGFTAIIVAWLARLDPRLIPFAAFFFAGILVGGDSIQISLGLPAATIQLFNGVILLFLVASEFFRGNRLILDKGDRA